MCLLWIGLLVCSSGGRQRRTVGWFARDTTEVQHDDFFQCLTSNTCEASESKSRAGVCLAVRKGSVCIAQYYASLLPPTLQRAKPSNVLVYGGPDLVIEQWGLFIRSPISSSWTSSLSSSSPWSTTSITTTYLSALATGSIATGDEETGWRCMRVCVCVCVCARACVCVCVCICVAARHIHQQFVPRSNSSSLEFYLQKICRCNDRQIKHNGIIVKGTGVCVCVCVCVTDHIHLDCHDVILIYYCYYQKGFFYSKLSKELRYMSSSPYKVELEESRSLCLILLLAGKLSILLNIGWPYIACMAIRWSVSSKHALSCGGLVIKPSKSLIHELKCHGRRHFSIGVSSQHRVHKSKALDQACESKRCVSFAYWRCTPDCSGQSETGHQTSPDQQNWLQLA